MDQSQIKKCNGCEQVKLVKEFNKAVNNYGATYHPFCKKCCTLRTHAANVVAKEMGLSKSEWIRDNSVTKRNAMVEEKFLEFIKNPPELNKQSRPETPSGVNSKQCHICKMEKSLDDFNNGYGLYGKHNYCRLCHRAKHDAYIIVANADKMTRREWIREVPKAERAVKLDVAFKNLIKARLLTEGVPLEVLDKEDQKYSNLDPMLNEVRARHKMELAKLNNKQTEIEEGFVYIMTNPAWNGKVKVGKAIDYETRLNSFNTGTPEVDYKMNYVRYFENRSKAEKAAHALLKDHRIYKNGKLVKEWFATSVEQAKEAIESIQL